jgi:hypothetical protein
MLTDFSQEIAARERTEEALKNNQEAAEKREAVERKAEIAAKEKRRKIQENRREQKEALNRQLADPRWGYMIEAEIAKADAKSRGERPPQTRRNPKQSVQNHQEVDEQDNEDPSAESPIERVHGVFPRDNNRNSPRPWTSHDRRTFIDVMKSEGGQDRYEIAAEQLNCSMDSIFQLAKELQELMDEMHETGKWSEPCDEWTYYIWVENE